MPRTLVRAPAHDRALSLGWLGVAWMEHFVRHGPGDVQGQPIVHGDEYTLFVADCYSLSDQGRLLYDSAFLSRPKGCDKSGLGARLALLEAFGPCRFAGFATGGEVYRDPWGLGFRYVYQTGEPMGRPVQSPFVRLMATEEGQTGNVYQTVYFNLTDDECPLFHVPGKDAGVGKVILPFGGEIRPSTASAASKDGGLETFCVLDETHLYTTPDLRAMYATVTRNLRKRKKIADTWFLETTTMFAPGENSTAEATFGEAEAIREGRKKRGRHRLLYDHRWGECKNLADEAALRAAIGEAYGDALAWVDVDGLVDEFYDTRSDPSKSRRYFLNAQTSSSDAWVRAHEWAACKKPDRQLAPRDLVTLGFDGSVREDASALVACRVSDGHLELLGCWEKPVVTVDDDWQVDREEVDACLAGAMRNFEVVGFYADPAHWQDYLDRWHNEYAEKMRVQATVKKPLEWWTNRPVAMVSALERLHEAILEERVSYTPAEDRAEGSPESELTLTLTRHVLNARRRVHRSGIMISKEHAKSTKKIDACMAACLAYEAACDARAKGVKPRAATHYAARRIR